MTIKAETEHLELFPTLATYIGVNEAILLQLLDKLIGDGDSIHLTIADIQARMPFLSGSAIKRTIRNLKRDGLIAVSGPKSRQEYAINRDSVDRLDGSVDRLAHRKRKRRQARQKRLQDEQPGCIYVCQKAGQPGYKIGLSVDVERRMAEMGTKLVFCFTADNMLQGENSLFAAFKDKNVEGEWFDLNDDDLETLQMIKRYEQGQFII